MERQQTLSPDFILASASPRRAELLRQIGARFLVAPGCVDESALPDEPPEDYVCRVAAEKARVGWQHNAPLHLPAMGADTAVVLDGKIFGKPTNKHEALAMLSTLSGRTHSVLSAVSLYSGDAGAETKLSETRVTFRQLSATECEQYWHTGEPADKAGAYGIQGQGAVFVSHIEGSYSGVVGLPIAETCQLMEQFELPWWQPQ